MKIELLNGHAIIKDYCPMKVGRDYDRKILMGQKGVAEGGEARVECVLDAGVIIIVGMLEKLVINGKEINVTVDDFEDTPDLEYQDYVKLKKACSELKDGTEEEEEEKKS